MSLTSEEIDDVLFDSRAGELEPVQKFVSERSVADLLLVKDEYSQATPLHMASANGHLELVELLINKVLEESAEACKSFVNSANEAGNTALHWACLNGHIEVVKALCKAGADPFVRNSGGHDAFFESDNTEAVIDYLLEEFSVEPTEEDLEGMDGDNENGDVDSASNGESSVAAAALSSGLQHLNVDN